MSTEHQAAEREVRLFLNGYKHMTNVNSKNAQATVQALKEPAKYPRQWDKLFNMLIDYLEEFLHELVVGTLSFPLTFYDHALIENKAQFHITLNSLSESLREILTVKTAGNHSMLGPHMYHGLDMEALNKAMQYISQLTNS